VYHSPWVGQAVTWADARASYRVSESEDRMLRGGRPLDKGQTYRHSYEICQQRRNRSKVKDCLDAHSVRFARMLLKVRRKAADETCGLPDFHD
jgi:hypothetical protein